MPILIDLIKNCRSTRNQADRWRKRRVVPRPVLVHLWDDGLTLSDEPPKTGIKLATFLELLWRFVQTSTDMKACAAALTLYNDTVRSELMPPSKMIRSEKYIKDGRAKWIPLSQIREIPGTIVR